MSGLIWPISKVCVRLYFDVPMLTLLKIPVHQHGTTWSTVRSTYMTLFESKLTSNKERRTTNSGRIGNCLPWLRVHEDGTWWRKHFTIDGEPISASLFDFGLYFFHNAQELVKTGTGPYFYLPKMESYLEARLWNDVFNLAQDIIDMPRGTIRGTVLIETIVAAFEMEEVDLLAL